MKTKLDFVHHDKRDIKRADDNFEWYDVMYEGVQVLTVQRKEEFPHRWVAHDMDGKQCFEPNQYRNDLFEQIEYEGKFK